MSLYQLHRNYFRKYKNFVNHCKDRTNINFLMDDRASYDEWCHMYIRGVIRRYHFYADEGQITK